MIRAPSLALLLALARTAAADPAAEASAANTEGLRLYDIHEWDAAIAKFKEAYRLRPDALSLFNLAQANRLKGDCNEALQFYRTYRRNYPEQANIPKVEKFITEMEGCAHKPAPVVVAPVVVAPVVAPPPGKQLPPPVTEPSHGKQLAGMAVAGAGTLAVVIGVVFAVKASQKADEVTHLMGMWQPALQSDGQRDAHVSVAMFAVGSAAIIGGAALYVLGRASAAEHVSVIPQHGGAAIAWGHAF